MAQLAQRAGELRQALGRPPQQRLRIAARGRVDQPLKILDQRGIGLVEGPAPTARAPDLPRLQALARLELGQPARNRVLADPRRADHDRDATRPVCACLRRRPQPPPALIALRPEQSPALRDPRLRQPRHDLPKPIRRLAHTTRFATRTRTPLHNQIKPPQLRIRGPLAGSVQAPNRLRAVPRTTTRRRCPPRRWRLDLTRGRPPMRCLRGGRRRTGWRRVRVVGA